ncbi:MAG: hypothetical protein QOI10_3409 [Solirubrobacterales bacterium]|jgi:hypothetical protein|nr:hypothetical protein [Solirubrobacterales bacterium]
MLDRLRNTLGRLQRSLFNKTEDAYRHRDAAENDSQAEAYAEGEAHAYSVAEDEVREAQSDEE